MSYIAYGCDGYAGGVKPDLEIVHSISMFDINVERLAEQYINNAVVVDQHTTEIEGDVWVTTLYANEWVKVEYTAPDGMQEICLYGPATPTI